MTKAAYKYFEDFEIGQVFEHPFEMADKASVMAFAREWDPQPIHVDEATAARFTGGIIASGLQTLLFGLRPFLHAHMSNSANLGGPGFGEIRWPNPVRPGDKLTTRVEVVAMRVSKTKPDRGPITFGVTVVNAKGDVVMTTSFISMLGRRPGGG